MAIHTVKLNPIAQWTIQGTWIFTKNGTASQTGTLTGTYTSPSDILEFDVPWGTDPVIGDVVTLDYVGDGDMYKAGGDPVDDKLEAFTAFPVTNCLDPTSNVGIVDSWSGFENCITGSPQILSARYIPSTQDVEVTFDRNISYADHLGAVIRNRTTGDIAVPIPPDPLYTTIEASGSSVLTYDNIEWATDPVSGDDLRFTYGAEVVILDNFNSTAGVTLPNGTPEIGGPWTTVDASHIISTPPGQAIGPGGAPNYWTNIIDGGEDGLSIFFRLRYLAANTGSIGAVLRSKSTIAASGDAIYTRFYVNASGAVDALRLFDWWSTSLYDEALTPFPSTNLFAPNGVEFVVNDLGLAGIEVYDVNFKSEAVILLGTLPNPPVGQTWAGIESEGVDTASDRQLLNFAIFKHPVGNYVDAAGTPFADVVGFDVVNPL